MLNFSFGGVFRAVKWGLGHSSNIEHPESIIGGTEINDKPCACFPPIVTQVADVYAHLFLVPPLGFVLGVESSQTESIRLRLETWSMHSWRKSTKHNQQVRSLFVIA
jgi:hypothetical protein